jgi:hypothetical protein
LFFALYGRVTFLYLSKEKSPKERISNMPALRVPCDARMSRQDAELAALRQTHPEPHPPILCFSASLNGGFNVKTEDEGPRTKDVLIIVIPACL